MAGTVYTIGCSNHPVDYFLQLLKKHEIAAIVDVRSVPYSRLHPQFNREPLCLALEQARIEYVDLGRELGARSEDPDCYENGKVKYERIAATFPFCQGMEIVERDSPTRRVALMCAEKDPIQCHRAILIARKLAEDGLSVIHILADGTAETHEAALSRLLKKLHINEDDLFRSREEALEEAYRIQGEAIAFSIPSEGGPAIELEWE